jgi:predicted DNA-binding protein
LIVAVLDLVYDTGDFVTHRHPFVTKKVDFFSGSAKVASMQGKKRKSERRISVRIPMRIKERLQGASERTGIKEADIIRSCVEALCDYVEEHGQLTLPFKIVPVGKHAEPEVDVAYSAKKSAAV